MKVLFLQEVTGTAKPGDVKEVSPGFARNYLFPKRLAVVADDKVVAYVLAALRVIASPEDEIHQENFYQTVLPEALINDARARSEETGSSLIQQLEQMARTAYRVLKIRGLGRIDVRLSPANEVIVIEANPNPVLACDEDFAQSALGADLAYPQLIERIAQLGMTAARD